MCRTERTYLSDSLCGLAELAGLLVQNIGHPSAVGKVAEWCVMSSSRHKLILIDAHVHLRRCFDIDQFLERAYANFEGVAEGFYHSARFVGVLFLVDSPPENGFERLVEQCDIPGDERPSKWRLQATRERTSVHLQSSREQRLIVIAGRQIISDEGLEVLAIGTRQHFGDGRPIAALIQDITRAGALPIVPWGAGKWMRKRGELVEQLLRDPELPQFFLGDSGNRPALWPQPSHFRLAEERGVKNLPGSDPLPLPDEWQRPGSFGFALKTPLNVDEPTRDLKKILLGSSVAIHPFGKGETPLRFLRNQVMMQCRNLTS